MRMLESRVWAREVGVWVWGVCVHVCVCVCVCVCVYQVDELWLSIACTLLCSVQAPALVTDMTQTSLWMLSGCCWHAIACCSFFEGVGVGRRERGRDREREKERKGGRERGREREGGRGGEKGKEGEREREGETCRTLSSV